MNQRNEEQSQTEKAIFDQNWELKLEEMRNAHGDKVILKKKVEHIRGQSACLNDVPGGFLCVVQHHPFVFPRVRFLFFRSGHDMAFRESIEKAQKEQYDQMCESQYVDAEVDRLSAKVRSLCSFACALFLLSLDVFLEIRSWKGHV